MTSVALARAIALGPRAIAAKLALRTTGALRRAMLRWRDARRESFEPVLPAARLRPRLGRLPLDRFPPPERLVADALAHRFDLLGSGPQELAYVDADPDGHWLAAVVDRCNLARAQAIWRLVRPGYQPIDWQRDLKSGHRWSAQIWSADIAIGTVPGADIKLPLELARMQHLPLFALAHAQAPEPRFVAAFRDQALDFLAANPPRFGVNWVIPMDVAIRAVNLLVAWDLFTGQGVAFDAAFEAELAAAMLAHGRFLAQNLEWQPDYRSNHYLADLVGLLFLAAYLPPTAETGGWSTLAAGELERETANQFLADGADHELSTCYHRLAAELVVYGSALVLGLGGALPVSHGARLAAMGAFARDATAPDGQLIQIGDNDDGRLMKLAGGEPRRDPAELHAALSGLIGPAPFGLAGAVVAALAGGRRLEAGPVSPRVAVATGGLRLPTDGARVRRFAAAGGGAPTVAGYPDFGLVVFRADWLYLAVVCRAAPVRWPGSHAHNDQLGIELWLDGQPVIRDPGSYLYTSHPEWRDRYRSVRAHDAPWLERLGEPAAFRGAFARDGGPAAELLYCGPDGFHGRLLPPAPVIHRAIVIEAAGLRIVDWVEGDASPRWVSPDPVGHSPGYGRRDDAPR